MSTQHTYIDDLTRVAISYETVFGEVYKNYVKRPRVKDSVYHMTYLIIV